MTQQIYWEDVAEGAQLPPLSKIASTQTLVKWAGASGDFNPLHYEDTFAVSQGISSPIIAGQLKRAWLIQMVTDWMGEGGTLLKFACQFRGMDYPRRMATMIDVSDGETLMCYGEIIKKYIDGDRYLVDCEIWVENEKGVKTTPGSATVILPSRESILPTVDDSELT